MCSPAFLRGSCVREETLCCGRAAATEPAQGPLVSPSQIDCVEGYWCGSWGRWQALPRTGSATRGDRLCHLGGRPVLPAGTFPTHGPNAWERGRPSFQAKVWTAQLSGSHGPKLRSPCANLSVLGLAALGVALPPARASRDQCSTYALVALQQFGMLRIVLGCTRSQLVSALTLDAS